MQTLYFTIKEAQGNKLSNNVPIAFRGGIVELVIHKFEGATTPYLWTEVCSWEHYAT